MLGAQYLWVDGLCIVQHDATNIAHNISSMSSIYAGAYFTINASGGADTDHGLKGLPTGSKPRHFTQPVLKFQPKCELLVELAPPGRRTPPFYQQPLFEYYRRGWTFQEELLSPRRLTFQEERVTWRCIQMSCREDVYIEGRALDHPR